MSKTPRTIPGTTDTPSIADVDRILRCTNAGTTTITLAVGALRAGDAFGVEATGGTVTFTAGAGTSSIVGDTTIAGGLGVFVYYAGDGVFRIHGTDNVATSIAAIAALTPAADRLAYFTGANSAALATLTAAGRALLDDADAAAQRTTLGLGSAAVENTVPVAKGGTGATTASAARTALGLVIGTDVQAQDAELSAIAGLTSAADRLPYFTGSGTAALATFTAAGRALVDDADAAAQRTTLGLPSLVIANTTTLGFGASALASVTTSTQTTAFGANALEFLTTANECTAFGNSTLRNASGFGCTAIGTAALFSATGAENTAGGRRAGFATTSAVGNTYFGYMAGDTITTGQQNAFFGRNADAGSATVTRGLALGEAAVVSHNDSVALGQGTTTTATFQVMVGPRDVEITSSSRGVILRSPDSTRWRLTVDNSGVVTTTSL